METLIIGSGSLGSLLAARLSAAGVPVTLFGRPSPHLTRIATKWLTVEEIGGSRLTVRLRTGTYGHPVRRPSLAILTVKTWATEEALRPLLPALEQTEAVLTLQSGIGNAQQIQKMLPSSVRVLSGVTMQEALRTDIGVVRSLQGGETWIGSEFLDRDPAAFELANRVAGVLTKAGWQTTATPEILSQLWSKLAVDTAILPLGALTRVANAEIADDPNLAQLAAYLASEAAAVAATLGIPLERPVERALEAARAAGDQRSAMLRDIEAGRRTEADMITGAIHELGEAHGVNTPITTMITILLYALERSLTTSEASIPTSAPE